MIEIIKIDLITENFSRKDLGIRIINKKGLVIGIICRTGHVTGIINKIDLMIETFSRTGLVTEIISKIVKGD